MRATTLDAYNLLHRGTEAIARAEWQGMRIDTEYCERTTKKLTYRIEKEEARFNESKLGRYWQHVYGTKYNPRSDQQLAHILYRKKKLKPIHTTESGQGSTDEEALKALNIPELTHLIRCRKLFKIRDTYLGSFVREQREGLLHAFFNLHTVKSYRSSSDSPNLQNIPEHDEEAKRICQRAIYPRAGHKFWKVDFSSIEVCVSACYNKDPTLLAYVKDPASDMHGDTAKDLFLLENFDKKRPEDKVLRFLAKNDFVFAQFYGSYYEDCARELVKDLKLPNDRRWKHGEGLLLPEGYNISDHFIERAMIESYSDFEEHVKKIEKDLWDNRFPVYAKWRKDWYRRYESRGYFDLLTGFRCQGYYKRNEAINLPIQGTAFHCLLWSFIRVDEIMRKERWDSKLVGEVHDDMILDMHPDEEEHITKTVNRVVSEELAAAWPWIIVPMRAEIKSGEIDGSLYTLRE